MKVSAEESLWLAFPILLVVLVLVGSIIYLQNNSADVRSRASEPKPVITPVSPTNPQTPEVVCSEIYQPVCGLNNKTYANECEANQDGVTTFTQGVCVTPTQIPLPATP